MAKRFIISEEERSNIRSRYGLINEQPRQLSGQEVFELQTQRYAICGGLLRQKGPQNAFKVSK